MVEVSHQLSALQTSDVSKLILCRCALWAEVLYPSIGMGSYQRPTHMAGAQQAAEVLCYLYGPYRPVQALHKASTSPPGPQVSQPRVPAHGTPPSGGTPGRTPSPRLYRGVWSADQSLVYISSRARGMETSGFGTPFWGSQIHAFWAYFGGFGPYPRNGLNVPSRGFHTPRIARYAIRG